LADPGLLAGAFLYPSGVFTVMLAAPGDSETITIRNGGDGEMSISTPWGETATKMVTIAAENGPALSEALRLIRELASIVEGLAKEQKPL
jgi:hypothetical protein